MNAMDVEGFENKNTTILFKRIIDSPSAFFKSQQRGEPELETEEKLEILMNVFNNQPLLFLSRYHTFLTADDRECFESCSADQNEINMYFPETSKSTVAKKPQNIRSTDLENTRRSSGLKIKYTPISALVRNRRYGALRKLIQTGKYFSDIEMRSRAPLLYQQMVGRHLTTGEMEKLYECGRECGSKTLSQMFISLAENERTVALLEEERQQENCDAATNKFSNMGMDFENRISIHSEQEEDEEEESELDTDDENEDRDGKQIASMPSLSMEERQQLREEFLALMHERFMEGGDAETFDYSTVDNNPLYDPMDLIDRDAQDAYFDSEDPS